MSEEKNVTMRSLEKHCHILSVTVRRWRGHFQAKDAVVTVAGDEVDKALLSKPQWRLFEKWNKELGPYESQIRKTVYERSVTFRDGVYIVPKTKAQELVLEVNALRDQYMAKVGEMVEKWDDFVLELSRGFSAEVWKVLSAKIPSKAKLPELYGVDISLWSSGDNEAALACLEELPKARAALAGLDRLRLDRKVDSRDRDAVNRLLSAVDAMVRAADSESGKLVSEGVGDWLSEVKATTSRVLEGAVNSMLEVPVQEFAEALANMEEVASNGRCRAATIDAVRRSYEKLKSFSFMVPAEILAKMERVGSRLESVNASLVNQNQTSASRLVDSLREIRGDLAREVEESRQSSGRAKRALFLD